MRNVAIFGATSAIAQSVARLYAGCGDKLVLIGRDQKKLEQIAQDLNVRGARETFIFTIDFNNLAEHNELIDKIESQAGPVDIALIAFGTLPDQKECERSVETALEAITTNGTSAISLLTLLANHMEVRGRGVLAAISSVAGLRGRQSNYVYGGAKALLTIFAAGLRNRLAKKNVHVLTIMPGFVDTPMTASFPKGPLWATPDKVGLEIFSAIENRKDVLYTPFFWRLIMLIIQHIPEFIFKKLSL